MPACSCETDDGLSYDVWTDGDGLDAWDAEAATDPDAVRDPDGDDPAPTLRAELWYAVQGTLVHVDLDEDDGTVAGMVTSTLSGFERDYLPFVAITMLEDGSLLLGYRDPEETLIDFYHIPDPPRDGSPVSLTFLGVMPDSIILEALYTDCDDRVYGMDTGVDHTSAEGNRLLRFTGDILSGDFSYMVISDLETADVADIDDMGPGLDDDGSIRDNPGFANDSGEVHVFDYETGSGTLLGGGEIYGFGVHALGGDLFTDGRPRVYVMSADAEIYEMDPETGGLSEILGTGPDTGTDRDGNSGLAGPLTDCDSSFLI
jgi:hypothetical protein